jgi:hypothetical protein
MNDVAIKSLYREILLFCHEVEIISHVRLDSTFGFQVKDVIADWANSLNNFHV